MTTMNAQSNERTAPALTKRTEQGDLAPSVVRDFDRATDPLADLKVGLAAAETKSEQALNDLKAHMKAILELFSRTREEAYAHVVPLTQERLPALQNSAEVRCGLQLLAPTLVVSYRPGRWNNWFGRTVGIATPACLEAAITNFDHTRSVRFAGLPFQLKTNTELTPEESAHLLKDIRNWVLNVVTVARQEIAVRQYNDALGDLSGDDGFEERVVDTLAMLLSMPRLKSICLSHHRQNEGLELSGAISDCVHTAEVMHQAFVERCALLAEDLNALQKKIGSFDAEGARTRSRDLIQKAAELATENIRAFESGQITTMITQRDAMTAEIAKQKSLLSSLNRTIAEREAAVAQFKKHSQRVETVHALYQALNKKTPSNPHSQISGSMKMQWSEQLCSALESTPSDIGLTDVTALIEGVLGQAQIWHRIGNGHSVIRNQAGAKVCIDVIKRITLSLSRQDLPHVLEIVNSPRNGWDPKDLMRAFDRLCSR
ncbi:MAG: hypothetical protein RL518_1622 [Pseudomonadota bacterium]